MISGQLAVLTEDVIGYLREVGSCLYFFWRAGMLEVIPRPEEAAR